jgi:hypothetical protein
VTRSFVRVIVVAGERADRAEHEGVPEVLLLQVEADRVFIDRHDVPHRVEIVAGVRGVHAGVLDGLDGEDDVLGGERSAVGEGHGRTQAEGVRQLVFAHLRQLARDQRALLQRLVVERQQRQEDPGQHRAGGRVI